MTHAIAWPLLGKHKHSMTHATAWPLLGKHTAGHIASRSRSTSSAFRPEVESPRIDSWSRSSPTLNLEIAALEEAAADLEEAAADLEVPAVDLDVPAVAASSFTSTSLSCASTLAARLRLRLCSTVFDVTDLRSELLADLPEHDPSFEPSFEPSSDSELEL